MQASSPGVREKRHESASQLLWFGHTQGLHTKMAGEFPAIGDPANSVVRFPRLCDSAVGEIRFSGEVRRWRAALRS